MPICNPTPVRIFLGGMIPFSSHTPNFSQNHAEIPKGYLGGGLVRIRVGGGGLIRIYSGGGVGKSHGIECDCSQPFLLPRKRVWYICCFVTGV